jgi:phosphatidylinositol-3-phosphatase
MIIGVTRKIKSLQVLCAAVALSAVLTAGCSGSAAPPAATAPQVFLIVMENKSPDEALGGSFTASLAARYGVAGNYRAVAHPSVPNYLALTSGQTWGVTDDSYHALPRQDLGSQLTSAGVAWRAYMEGMTAGCLDSPVPYDPGHNPFAFYGGACPANVVPLTSLDADLNGNTPRFSWITPDMCHDEHSCAVQVGDAWLRQEVGKIMASNAWSSNGVLIITWDEDDGSQDNRVLTLVVAPHRTHEVSSRPYTHYSLLASVEDLLGVGRLANAAQATPMSDLIPTS